MNDGGPAFPISGETWEATDAWPFKGMSLRDWLAGQALIGLCSTVERPEAITADIAYKDAVIAYRYADAMLKARNESKEMLEHE